ncbi:MAG: hypothetical protein JNM31_04600 [Flavobacteriales bacterium]|nr:hypothetical protein [Flavobacteriales bacterium]
MLRRILASAKWTAVNLVLLWRHRKEPRKSPGGGPIVFVDLQANPFERYLLLLLLLFRNAGHRIAFKPTTGMLGAWSTTLLQDRFPEAEWRSVPPPGTVLVLTDRPREAPDGAVVRLLDADYFAPPQPGTWRVPMPMVDSVYVFHCEEPRQPPPDDPLHALGRIRIYFSGGFDPAHYSHPAVREVFHCLSRREMNQVLHMHFGTLIEHPKDKATLASSHKPIRLVDRHKDFYVDPIDLRWVLAHSDFLPAFPGVVMPWTHSVVEGMSVGAVPILQFPQLFDPPLQHGVDCLAFKDEDGLVHVVQQALDMDATRIERMRAAAKSYYERHMAPDVVVRRILDPQSGDQRLRLMAEWHSVRLWQRHHAGTRPH